jgi:hypothetical protein
MPEEEKIAQLSSSSVDRLLDGDGTLYNERPSRISALLKDKLNSLSRNGHEASIITAIPDYHKFGDDGGIKDILIITKPSSSKSINWEVTTVLGSDNETMHGFKTPDIQDKLSKTIIELEQEGNTVRHVIPITDSHNFGPTVSGVGGYDGLKNIVICYYKQ